MSKNPRSRRDADDLSSLPDAELSGPGAKPPVYDTTALDDLVSDIPVFAAEMGGPLLAAATAEEETGTPEEFLVLSYHARFACRLRAGGTRVKDIAEMMNFHVASISQMTRKPVARRYIEWLQGNLDNQAPVILRGMHLIAGTALSRLNEIVQHSKNDNLVAKCTFQIFDRIGLPRAEALVIEDNRTITTADIARMKETGASLQGIINAPTEPSAPAGAP